MCFTLSRFQQHPDNRETNQRTARIAHEDFIAASQHPEVQENIRQDRGNHRETPHGQAVLPVEPQNDTDCGK
ncbi:hypothetical protein D3C76_1678830 [compost metagenome]